MDKPTTAMLRGDVFLSTLILSQTLPIFCISDPIYISTPIRIVFLTTTLPFLVRTMAS
jgi:hypothetical protein